jgi:Hemerythrin HHE cation binding domain
MVAGSDPSTSGLYGALTFHHARLEASGRHALSMLQIEGSSGARASFRAFERELIAHFEAEETWVLPAFARARPQAYEAVRAEHAQLRSAVDAVARSFGANAADQRALHDLLERLLELWRREEGDLYRWAETAIGESDSRAVIQKIEAAELGEK